MLVEAVFQKLPLLFSSISVEHSTKMVGGDHLENSLEYEGNLIKILLVNGITTEITDKQSLQRAQSLYSDLYVDLAFSAKDNEQLIVTMERQLNKSIKEYLMNNETSLFVSANQEIIVSPSAKKPGSFQLSFFDKNGPIMDLERDTKEEVFKELKVNFCTPLRNEFAQFIVDTQNLNIGVNKTMKYVFELENVDLLVERYKDYLDTTGLYNPSEINDFAENDLKNSKVDDVDYLLEDLSVSINDGAVVDLTYKSKILEMMEKDYSNFIQSLISIEIKIMDKDILSEIYDKYMNRDNITLISAELYEDTEPTMGKNRESLLDKMNRIEGNKSSGTKGHTKEDLDLER